MSIPAFAEGELPPCEISSEACETCRSGYVSLPEDRVKLYCGDLTNKSRITEELPGQELRDLVRVALGNQTGEQQCRGFISRLTEANSISLNAEPQDVAFAQVFRACNSIELNIFGPSIEVSEDGYPSIDAVSSVLALNQEVTGAVDSLTEVRQGALCVERADGEISVRDFEERWKTARVAAERAVACDAWFETAADCLFGIPREVIDVEPGETVQEGRTYPLARQHQVDLMRAYRVWLGWWDGEFQGLEDTFSEITDIQREIEALRIFAQCPAKQ